MRLAGDVRIDCPAYQRSDAELIAAIARADEAAFRTLVERHLEPIHRLAWRLLGETSEAEDVAQETFLRLWTHAGRWRATSGGGRLAWLRRVATNLCLDRLRRKKFASDEPVPERPDPDPSAAEAIDRLRLGELARSALASLPDRQRAAVVLTYYEELPNSEAAEMLNMKLKAFESLLFRARAVLRDSMARAGITAADLGAQG